MPFFTKNVAIAAASAGLNFAFVNASSDELNALNATKIATTGISLDDHGCIVTDYGDYKSHSNCHASPVLGNCDYANPVWTNGDQFFNCTCYDGSWSVECPEAPPEPPTPPKTPKQNCEDNGWSGDGWKCDDDGTAHFILISQWWFWAIMIPLGLFIGFLIIRSCIQCWSNAATASTLEEYPDAMSDLELASRSVASPMRPNPLLPAADIDANQPVGIHLEQKSDGQFVTVRDSDAAQDPYAFVLHPPPQTNCSTLAQLAQEEPQEEVYNPQNWSV